jgi:uncharacterized protein (TIGR03435 family)
MFYNIDQAGPMGAPWQGNPSTAFSVQGASLKIAIDSFNGVYEGQLSADGSTIAGAMKMGPTSLPLNLKRATVETAWKIPEAPPELPWMAANAPLTMEVATIKPTKPGNQGDFIRVKGRHLITGGTSLSRLIAWAYEINPSQFTGGPAWVESDHFDIQGEPEGEGQPTYYQWKIIVQKLLEDRFQLKLRHEKKEMPVYALRIAKGGSKLKLSQTGEDPNAQPWMFFTGPGVWPGTNVATRDFISLMQRTFVDRPIVDETGLTGRYDFLLKFAIPDAPPLPEGVEAPPSLFTAVQEQLGLKLEPAKLPADFYVIEHVEKPSEN